MAESDKNMPAGDWLAGEFASAYQSLVNINLAREWNQRFMDTSIMIALDGGICQPVIGLCQQSAFPWMDWIEDRHAVDDAFLGQIFHSRAFLFLNIRIDSRCFCITIAPAWLRKPKNKKIAKSLQFQCQSVYEVDREMLTNRVIPPVSNADTVAQSKLVWLTMLYSL